MSLMKIRTDWLKLSRDAESQDAGRKRVLVAASFTADPIAPYLGVDLTEDPSVPPIITIAPYDQIFQICYNFKSDYADQQPDAIVVLWRIEDFLLTEFRAFLLGHGMDAALSKVDSLASAVGALRSAFTGALIVSLPPFPHGPDHHIRSLRSSSEGGAFHRRVVDRLLARISEIGGVSYLDLDGLQRHVGIPQAADSRKWRLYRQPFTELFWREIASAAAALVRAQTTAPKKCVIVDCDNTLWGGVVGEDGLQGISLGADFPGSAFVDFHHQLLGLRAQGVLIALCSKNNEQDVWDVFERHDAMILRREHVVCHRINWQDKPSNIMSIAQELNIGLDSLVFIDDSSMEIEHVRSALPMVTCLQVPTDVSAFPDMVAAYRGFDREKISNEDRERSDMMIQERDRRELATALDGEAFRKALALKIDVFDVKAEHVARVVQLINKTNQFNLTTVRMTQAELTALLDAPGMRVLAWKVADRFGDYGLVGVAILRLSGEEAKIEAMLMSCRVLGRGVERSIMAALCEIAGSHGALRLSGEYRKTAKNQLVASLYADHGFTSAGGDRWVLDDLSSLTWPEEIERV